MKVFIAGPRAIENLDDRVIKKINSICSKNYTILVGDADGIDSAVQSYLKKENYKSVTVYATEGKYRNNLGNWNVECVPVKSGTKGFQYYEAKDIKMAKDADCGFMIWNGESKGTLNNILNLISLKKNVIVYLQPQKELYLVKSFTDVNSLINICSSKTKILLDKLMKSNKQVKLALDMRNHQLALNM